MKKMNLVAFSMAAMFGLVAGVNAQEVSDVTTLNNCLSKDDVCQLTQNITSDTALTINNKTVLDLNGYTLTSDITDLGDLTIKSSKEGGKLVLNNSIRVGEYDLNKSGKITLESGTIENKSTVGDKGYGILCMNGSTVIINGGAINSTYAGITGNNTKGNMYFEINGGTLTAEKGPAIYMPGPVSLKMTNGTLNGGISLRMGIVDISGGVINAITKEIDEIKDYYDKSLNVWLADALYVMGGTYTSKDSNQTNKLDLKITGGTFNVTNTKGSVVAIYDIGHVAQDMNVSISGNAKLVTNSETRNAYDILTLADIGVAEPVTGYGNENYVGKVSTSIKGGTFSSDVSEYVDSKYITKNDNNLYTVVENKIIETTDKKVTFESETALDNSYTLQTTLATKKQVEDAQKLLNEYYKDNNNVKDTTLVTLYDIKVSDGTNVIPMENGKFTISIDIDENVEYDTYKVVYIDEDGNISEVLDAKRVGNKIVFETTHLSNYGVVGYNEVEETPTVTPDVTPEEKPEEKPVETPENPDTSDNVGLMMIVSCLSLFALGTAVLKLKKGN